MIVALHESVNLYGAQKKGGFVVGNQFWQNLPWGKTVLIHTVMNLALPLLWLGVVSVVTARPELLQFAIHKVLPWAGLASLLVVPRWLSRGRSGAIATPPRFVQNVLPNSIAWAAFFAGLSLIVGSLAAGKLVPLASIDGGISAFIAAMMSGLALSKQAQKAFKQGDY